MEGYLGGVSILGVTFLVIGNAMANQITMFANNPEIRETINANGFYVIAGLLGTFGGMFWAPIYVGLHLGILVGFVSFVLLNIASILLGKLITNLGLFHFVVSLSSVMSTIGLYLTITSIPD